jgi:hypothetical protein
MQSTPAGRRARPLVLAAAALLFLPHLAQAQNLQETLNDLFVFGGGDNPLFLGGSAGLPETEVHGDHFIPSESETNGSLLEFFNRAISANIGSFPLSSTVSSETFTFVGGVPQASTNSFGPVFAERAETIGKGRLNAAVNYSRLRFKRIRGVDLDDVQLTFLHSNVDFPGCDEAFGGDCTLFGVPQFENDQIDFALDLDLQADLLALSTTFGLTDRVDLSLAVPIVQIDLAGSSLASISPTTQGETAHFFGGTPESPVLEARTRASEQAGGVGDVAARVKAHVVRSEPWNFGVLGELRIPTGREEDFLGTGDFGGRGLLIVSGRFGNFAPHVNAGYELVGGNVGSDEVGLVAGFDHRLAEWATLAVDVLGAFPVGEEKVTFPERTQIEAPFSRSIRRTNIPNRRDEQVDGSLGFKFRTGAGLVIVTNVLVPMNQGGLRTGVIPTVGLEYAP